MKNKTKEQIYLEWLNDYITVKAMAEDYNMNESELKKIIDAGRDEYIIKTHKQPGPPPAQVNTPEAI